MSNRASREFAPGFAFAWVLVAALCARMAWAEPRSTSAALRPEPAGVEIKAASVPFSALASPQARSAFIALRKQPPEPSFGSDVAALRRFHSKGTDKILAGMRRLYETSITSETLGGVRVDVVVPAAGIAPENRDRVLIELHSGGFLWGGGSEALLEAIPIAAVGRLKVISVNYRMAPEHAFPAASEDVAAVYRALLKQFPARNIGIYGCSAGGILAAESVAWFAAHRIPQPGAIASLCGTGAELQGDSAYLAPLLLGTGGIQVGGKPLLLTDLPYFKGVSERNPLAFPIVSPRVLKQFPPTLLIAGSRDFTESSETLMRRRLWEAGAESQLFVFDGLWHAFMMDPKLPESQEVYRIVWRFFDEHLRRSK
jgi:epsilon-lactone hydrolase